MPAESKSLQTCCFWLRMRKIRINKQMAAVFKCFTSVIHFSTFPSNLWTGNLITPRDSKFLIPYEQSTSLLPAQHSISNCWINLSSVIPSSNRFDVIKLLAFFAPTTTWLTEIFCKIRIGDTKRDHICCFWRKVLRGGITGWWGSKGTNFIYKISTKDVIYNAINIMNAAVCYIWKWSKRANSEDSHHKEKSFCFFLYLYELLGVH